MNLSHVRAVVGAAVAVFLLGALWYSPLLFAKQWVRANGYTPEKLERMKATAGRAYGVSFLCYVVTAAVFSLVLAHLGADTAAEGAGWGFHIWLGFALTLGLTANMFSDKPLAAFAIDAGYQLVYLILMGAILAAWGTAH